MSDISKNAVCYFSDVRDDYGSFVIYISRQKLRLRKSEQRVLPADRGRLHDSARVKWVFEMNKCVKATVLPS